MKINVKLARSDNFTSKARKLADIAYIVIHYTGNRGDTAKNNADYFARERTGTSAHFFVDEREIYQSVQENHTAWHCGTKGQYYNFDCRNWNSIGVEICMLDELGHVRQGSIDHAAELVRELMWKYGILAERVVRHYDVTHKSCPEPMVLHPELWQAFKDKIQEDDDMKYYEKITDIPAGEMRDTVQLLIDRKAIAGNGSGLHLSEDMVRMMVYNSRMGLYK